MAALAAAAAVLAGCSSGSAPGGPGPSGGGQGSGANHTPRTIRVPQDIASLTRAAKQAGPGDVILVSPGVYHASVQIDADHVTLRGTDRNRVILDEGVLRPNGVVLTGDGDAVQNLTVRNATLNGVLVTGETDNGGRGIGKGSDGYSPDDQSKFPPVNGFLVDHVTSYNNGLYGVYAFDAQHGQITGTYTSGMADSGLYVGQCKPCDIAVHGNVAERNAVGYEGTNASGEMYVYGNRFVGNRVGATTDSDHQEGLVPQRGATIVGNVIADNNATKTPEQADGGFGIGFGIAGGTDNTFAHNLVVDNHVVGVEITNADDLAPSGNHILANRFSGNGVDFVYSATAAAPGSGNCLQANTIATVRPAAFPRSCPTAGKATGATAPATHAPSGIPFTDVAAPPVLPQLPGADSTAAARVTGAGSMNADAIATPSATLLQSQSTTRW